MEDLFLDFTLSVLRLNKLVQKIKAYEVEKIGLKPIHVLCSYYLNKNPQGLTAKELGEMSLEDKGAISRALQTMRAKGYVVYDAGCRNAPVRLTDAGREMTEYVCSRVDRAVKASSVEFTPVERAFFYKALDTIVNSLNEYCKELKGEHD